MEPSFAPQVENQLPHGASQNPPPFREYGHAENPDGMAAVLPGDFPTGFFVHEEEIRAKLPSENDGFALPTVEMEEQAFHGGKVLDRHTIYPFGKFIMANRQLVINRLRNDHVPKNLTKHPGFSHLEQS
ncbi:MAG: hypothetical protein ACOYM3_18370 [Terrimicrobiaceae bacterium]